MSETKELELIKRIKALADIGLVYTENNYDRERYEELASISLQLLSTVSGKPLTTLESFFMPGKDYQTPKVDVRGLVINEKKEVLLAKEKVDGKWSIPGGWGDIGYSPSEVVVKEIEEETGLVSKVSRLLAVYDKKCHPHPPEPFYVYKLIFLCEVIGGAITPGFDIEDARYFSIEGLPELSENRILKSQIEQLYSSALNGNGSVHFD
ncbi:NUDIX hydrolase [Fulvivirga sp. M361]|uniref:NUDIX hydrolase n=1 Tax=Fulvivirga sp. M361 TaxID=2594266 RepID=UPI0011799867|nr:NUDIX hydrolase [Fulvivirga sp. M361]TRX52027.1 NUDIX hydrolase [Fulvivirga sp. M361]